MTTTTAFWLACMMLACTYYTWRARRGEGSE